MAAGIMHGWVGNARFTRSHARRVAGIRTTRKGTGTTMVANIR